MIPLVPYLLGALAAVVLSFGVGYKVRGDAEKAKQLTLERGWHEAYRQGVAQAQAAAASVGATLLDEQASRAGLVAGLRSRYLAEKGKIRLGECHGDATKQAAAVTVAATDGGEPDRGVSLTDDFRLRYDTALSLVVPSGDRARWVDAAGAAAGATDLWTVLDVHTENASRWAQCREMMTAAQQWFKQMGWVN